MDLNLNDKTVLITGASRGIGAAVARAFAREGARHLHLVSRTSEDLEVLGKELRGAGVEVTAHACDVGDPDDRARLADRATSIDVLVNNAGAIPAGGLRGADLEAWRQSWELKVWGYLDLSQRYLGSMSAHGGVIVNNIGVAGERSDPDYVAGTAANAALIGFTRAVGATSMDHDVRVVGVNPGLVETDRVRGILEGRAAEQLGDADRWRELTSQRPAGRIASADEIADAIVFLASPRSSYTSGTVLTIDGGFSSRGRTF